MASDAASSARLARGIKLAVLAALLWTALGVLFATQLYFAGLPWGQALEWSIPRWYAWGLLTPVIFWCDRRLHGRWSPLWRVAMHIPLGVGFTFASILLRLAARPLRGAPWPDNLGLFVLERFYPDLVIYGVIAGVSMSRTYAAQVRQQEAEAATLAVAAAALERRLIEARLQSLRAQLQPHFLFNALNTISAFTETDPPRARRLMERLGDLLRASLTHATRPLVPLDEELAFLDDYLAIERARFEDRLAVDVDVADDLRTVMVPGFFLQPIVENAIRHGVAPRASGGRIIVTAARQGQTLTLGVRDDGVGLPAGWSLEGTPGVGLRNVAARLEHLYDRTDLLRIGSNHLGGVDVQIDLPPRQAGQSAIDLTGASVHA